MPHKILFVDDEPNVRLLTQALLERKGYIVECAVDGLDALEKIPSFAPDLIITDLRMPNMSGFELLFEVRTHHPKIPTIAISGHFIGPKVEGGPLVDAFFQKGHHSPDEFLSKIEQLLNGQKGEHKYKTDSPTPVWSPTADAPIMLTCTHCLRSFPIDPCRDSEAPNRIQCKFCGAQLEFKILAIAKAG